MELSGQKVSAEAVESKPGPAEAAAAGSSRAPVTASGVPEWGCYPDARSMDELLSYLNPKGQLMNRLLCFIHSYKMLAFVTPELLATSVVFAAISTATVEPHVIG